MMEDKLTHDERLRLECVAQAIAYINMKPGAQDVVKTAKEFEEYVRAGATEKD